ncbi:elastin binding protein ebpS [Staphylococcus aureus]|uniref:Elastin binding protein ebpS n=1 Tax=Staphylococcus aureus TaxID=1280 RepID=A0A380E1M9_STAAU|nr:elastin binding protein ebpS [Staphylococcus aureus]
MPKEEKRRRDLATNHNKQVHNESQTSEDNVQNEAGTIDDRQVESSHSTESQEPSHQDSTPQHEEEYYNKNAFAMDKSHPEPIEDNDKHETVKDAENNTEHSTVSDKSEAEHLSNLNHILQQVLTKQIHQKINMMMIL